MSWGSMNEEDLQMCILGRHYAFKNAKFGDSEKKNELFLSFFECLKADFYIHI